MKRIQRVASFLLAMVMVFAMTVTAFAVEGDENPPSGGTGRYVLYQIFTGEYEDANNLANNVLWGKNGTGEKGKPVSQDILDELAAVSADGKTDEERLDVIEKYCNKDKEVYKQFDGTPDAKGFISISDVEEGYYLLVDTGSDPQSKMIAQVSGTTFTFKPKTTSVPTPDKEVRDRDDSVSQNNLGDWDKSADYDIGDYIPFRLTAKLPENLGTGGYKLTFVDTLSKGLTYNASKGIVIKVNDTEIKASEGVTLPTFVPSTTEDGKTELRLTFDDVTAPPLNAGAKGVITIEYEAQLNEDAEIGAGGNINEFRLEYVDGDKTSSTPTETVVVFTFKTVVNKVKEDGTVSNPNATSPLEGAGFTLKKLNENGIWDDVKKFENTDGKLTSFSFDGLDAGRYQLVESKVPDGYNSIDPIYFTIEATHGDLDKGGVGLKTLEVYETDANGNKLTANKTADFTVTLTDGSATTDIVNKQGALLPSTGGIGTTIFYVVGGILVVVAGVLLVTRRRMSR